MALPLIALAIGSVVAGFVGIPHALGGSNRIERFLEPSFEAHAAAPQETTAAQASPGAGTAIEPAQHAEPSAADAHALENTELRLMAISTGVAVAGIGIAVYFWLRNRAAADALARRFRPIHALLSNKYYVDELYNAAIVQPIKQLSMTALWRGVDAGLIDGTVNGVGVAVRASSGALRRLQTGSVRTYAAATFAGVVLILAYYLLRGRAT